MMNAAKAAIPKSSGKIRPKTVPWWTRECTEANKQRKTALRRYQRTLLINDRIEYCRKRAIAKHVQNTAKQESWKNFVSTVNVNTPMTKIWKRIRKIRGSYASYTPPSLVQNHNHITDSDEVAELLARHYERIGSNESYTPAFQRRRQSMERELNFATAEELTYNSPITILELKRNLSLCGSSAPGADNITYNMIKHSHETCLKFLLAIMNRIFSNNVFPTLWQNNIVLSFLKTGKDSNKEENYRPISLCLQVFAN